MTNVTQLRTAQPILSDDQLFRMAPSIFAEAQREGLSEKYAFIPTTRVLNLLRSHGWQPVKAMQSKARTADGREYAKHVIRFRNPDAPMPKVGDVFTEMLAENSHNGTSAYRLSLGAYRLVCSNGMAVGKAWDQEKIRHVGFTDDSVIEASFRILGQARQLAERVDEFESIKLERAEQLALAEASLTAAYGDDHKPVRADQLLSIRRFDDKKDDLWTTFNRIQENVVRGGLRGRASTGRRTSTREIQSVDRNLNVNRALWQLAESMRNMKTGREALTG